MTINLPKLIGHRGVRDLAPENTIQSIKKAIELNIKWVEIDVKISKDHIPFLLHDSSLERTTSGNGSPLNYKYSELYKLDAGSWFNEKHKNLHPPTLKETLELCSQKNIGVNIELKPNKGSEEANVVAVTELIMKHQFDCQYFLSSFDWFSATKIKKLLPESYVGILIDGFDQKRNFTKMLNKCNEHNFFSCGFNIKIISDEIIKICKNDGILVTVYSSQNIEKNEAEELWNLGVDSIFIDNPTSYKNMLE
jgi:glycerophosphoryl diester phosphodiesterase